MSISSGRRDMDLSESQRTICYKGMVVALELLGVHFDAVGLVCIHGSLDGTLFQVEGTSCHSVGKRL